MHYRFAAIGAAILLCTTGTLAHAQAAKSNSRTTLRNDVGLELLGKGVFYSFSYQRMLIPAVGLEAGLGALGGGSSEDNTSLIFVPVSAKLYLIPRDGSIYLTAGAVLVTGTVNDGPFDESGSDFYGQVGLGFEYRAIGGFLIRGTAYTLFSGGSYFIWPGLSVGYAF